MKAVVIIVIAFVLLVPSTVFGEEIPIKLELNRETAQKGDPIILETTVEKVIPNTNLIIMIFKDGVSEYRSNPLTSGSPIESNTQSTVLRFDTRPSGSYEIFAYYGIISTEERDGYYYVTESLGSNSVNLEYFSEYGSTTNFLYDEIMPDKFDIGTSWTTIQQNVPRERICEIDFCYDAMAWNEFVDSTRNGRVTTLIYYFDDDSVSGQHKKYFEKRTDFVTGDTENIENIVECKVSYEFSSPSKYTGSRGNESFFCLLDNFVFIVSASPYEVSGEINDLSAHEQGIIFTKVIAENILSNSEHSQSTRNEPLEPPHDAEIEGFTPPYVNPNELGIASFVDKSKDPQHYIDRYNKEESYREWFHENYPQYDTIEQAVGLELTEKIPDWVKNIFGWYAADQVSEDELLNAIKYLINEGILIVD